MSGLTNEGLPKVRPIDDMTASDINAATAAQEKMSYDTLDLFLEALRKLKAETQVRCLDRGERGACHAVWARTS